MLHNLSKIMSDAWGRYYDLPDDGLKSMSVSDRRCRFASCLRQAWYAAKQAMRKPVELTPAKRLRRQVVAMENRTTLGWDGIQELSRLKADLVAVGAEERRVEAEKKRDIIKASEGHCCTVSFIKKDGSLRQMRVQPAGLKFHAKGDAATDAGRKGAVTRAARHPHLLPVWDAEKRVIRSVNLDTGTRVAVGGQVQKIEP